MIAYKRLAGIAMLAAGLISSGAVVARGQTFTRAASGWLYVVTSDYKTHKGRVLVVDPASGRIAGAMDKGYQPEVIPSSDGTRLFVTYDNSRGPGGAFEVIDGATGAVSLHIDEPYARGGIGSYSPRMVLSRDGSWLYRYKAEHSMENGYSYWIETFDAAANVMLPERVKLPVCGWTAAMYLSLIHI